LIKIIFGECEWVFSKSEIIVISCYCNIYGNNKKNLTYESIPKFKKIHIKPFLKKYSEKTVLKKVEFCLDIN